MYEPLPLLYKMILFPESDLFTFFVLPSPAIEFPAFKGLIIIGLIEFSTTFRSILSIFWLLFLSNFAITLSILLPSSPFFFFYTFLLSSDPFIKLVFIINRLLFDELLLSIFSIIFDDFCLYYVENILLEISGSLALWIGPFFMFIFTKLKDCPVWPNYFIEKRLGFDFGVGIAFLFGFVILKLLISFFSYC